MGLGCEIEGWVLECICKYVPPAKHHALLGEVEPLQRSAGPEPLHAHVRDGTAPQGERPQRVVPRQEGLHGRVVDVLLVAVYVCKSREA